MSRKKIASTLIRLQYMIVLLLFALMSTKAEGQALPSRLECARLDTLDIHPISTAEDIRSFAGLLEDAKKAGVDVSMEALEKAFEAATDLSLREERVLIGYYLTRLYSSGGIALSKQLKVASSVNTDIEFLPWLLQSSALNGIGIIYAISGDHVSALSFYQRAYESADSSRLVDKIYPLGNLSTTYLNNQDTTTALEMIHRLVSITAQLESQEEVSYNHVYDFTLLASIHLARGATDSAKHYAEQAEKYCSFFKPNHARFKEMQVTVFPVTIRQDLSENKLTEAFAKIKKFKSYSPEIALLFEAEYYKARGDISKALSLSSTPITTELVFDKKRLELRRETAIELGKFEIAQEASSQLLAKAEESLTRSVKEVGMLYTAKMTAVEKEREADVSRYQQQLDALQTRQKTWVAGALILLSLGIALWFNQRFRASQKRSNNLRKIVTQHEEDLIIANNKLASKVSSMERFNHLLSHDLREPLRSISGFTSILKRKAKPYTELSEDFDMLSRSLGQLAYLMTGVEHLRRVEEKKVHHKVVDPKEVLVKVIADVKSKYSELNTNIITKGNFESFETDKNLLYKTLLELVDNAVKFCKEDTANVTIEAVRQGDKVIIYVQDEGIGMDKEFSDQIFSVFKRLNRRENYVGSGVGLALAKLASEKCSGSVTLLESRIGIGSTFKLTLPLLHEANQNPKERAGSFAEV